ncbi:class I SAM-dependent methyltransferase [Kushneria phosphatilytica]|uniref:Class I SAM-dependent methyltransferase n=1 Tax=Kushneria phosphatilytica TaxID=657387 RepID=A0A5C1A4K9_9GAMM|nr:class I SAM-dependent methyltransferase [Kushneria phosphatilytica]QEL11885.1 class I SAM-dependent methyltransferase [Kushneria phosphatilytica]
MSRREVLYQYMADAINRLDHQGRWLRYHYRDRRLLEGTILPAIARNEAPHRLLMVGCDWYTRHYPRYFNGCSVTTMDIDAAKACFGAQRHITDSMAHVTAHFEHETLDTVICNGVIGWGLDEREEIEQALAGCVSTLRANGMLLIGWNDKAPHNSYAPDAMAALSNMVRINIPGLATHEMMALARNRHTFQAWRKPPAMTGTSASITASLTTAQAAAIRPPS